jgi:autotransporter-associated beta strand protein
MRIRSALHTQLLATVALGALTTTASAQTVPINPAFAGDPSTYVSAGGTVLQGVQDITVPRALQLSGGATTIDTGVYTVGWTGNITSAASPPGTLTKAGSGTLVIMGANSVTPSMISAGTVIVAASTAGNATIASGATLQIGNGGTSGSLNTNSLVNNGTLVFNRSDTYTPYLSTRYSGAPITGTGTIKVTGGGTINFRTLPANFDGNYIIESGTLNFVADSWGPTATLSNEVVDNGVLGYTSSASGLITSSITGTGSLTVATSYKWNTVTLTGNNTYTGGTTIGHMTTLQIGNGGTTGSIAGPVTFLENTPIVFNRSDTYIFSGDVSGSGYWGGGGWIQQNGSGKLIYTGTAGPYVGVTVSAGTTIQIGNGGTTGSFGDPLFLAGTIIFNRSDTYTYAGSTNTAPGVTPGTLEQAGAGTLILTGTIDTTTTIIDSGSTLQLGDGGESGWHAPSGRLTATTVVNNGTLAFNYSNTSGFWAAISGTGSVHQIGSGTMMLTGNNTYTGGTTITAGTLQIGNGVAIGTITGDVLDNGTLAFNRSDTYTFAGNISGSGGISQIGSGTTILTGHNTYTGGTWIAAGTLAFGHSGTVTLAGSVSGSGNLIQAGTGSLVLNGVNTYTGQTTVAAGTLMIGDDAHPTAQTGGAVLVGNSATLRGHGTILGPVTNNASGTVAPGGSIGTLTVGSYTQGPNGTLDIEVAPAASSVLQVTGSAAIAGHLKFDFDPGVYGTHSYRFLTAGSLTGTFADVQTTGAPGGEAFGIRYGSGTIDLVVTPVAAAQVYSDFLTSSLQASERFADQVSAHQLAQSCRPAGQVRDDVPTCPERSVWGQAFAGFADQDAKNGALAYGSSWQGVVGGVDARSGSGLSFGIAATYVRSVLGVSGTAHLTIDMVGISAMAGIPLLEGSLDISGLWTSSNGLARRTVMPDNGSVMTVRSQPQNSVLGGSIQYSHGIALEGGLSGFARLNLMSLNQRGLTETGAMPYDFTMASAAKTGLSADIGLRLVKTYHPCNDFAVVPDVSLAVRSYLDQDHPDLTETLAEATGPSFSVSGPARANTAFVGGIGVTAERADGIALFLRGDGRISGSAREGAISIGGRIAF